jgi:mRNA interferase RelE/StbE
MKILIDNSFEKDVYKISDKKLINAIADCIQEIQSKNKISEISNCKKLKGNKRAFRIRIGNYRIGFVFENQTIKFVSFLHRQKLTNIFLNNF